MRGPARIRRVRACWRAAIGLAAATFAACRPAHVESASPAPGDAIPKASRLRPPPLIGDPAPQSPVAAAASAQPARAAAGQVVAIVVRLKLAGGWHIYPPNQAPATLCPLTLRLELPAGTALAGEWIGPAPLRDPETGDAVYRGDVLLHQDLKVARDAPPGHVSIPVEIGYQACDPLLCRPPERKVLNVELEILPASNGR